MGESPILAGDIGVDLTPLKILDMSDIIAGLGFAPVNHVDLGTYLNRRILNGVGYALRGRANPRKSHGFVVGEIQFEGKIAESNLHNFSGRDKRRLRLLGRNILIWHIDILRHCRR
ncbi:hypothetical protein D3C86_1881660 [compost metagenome]